MRGPQVRGLETLRELCGTDAKTNLVLLTTFWDRVDVEAAAAREVELIDKFWRKDFLTDGASECRLQPRTRDRAWEIIDIFKTGARLTPKPLKIQVEMGDKHKRFYETSVFRYLLNHWTKIVDEFWGAGQAHTPSSMQQKAKAKNEKATLVGAIPKNRREEYGVKRKYRWF